MESTLDALKKKVEIDKDNLEDELVTQCASFLYIAERSVNAEMAFEIVKADLDRIEAEVDQRLRMEAAESGKKTTESQLSALVAMDAKVRDKRLTLIKARGTKEVLKALRDAMYMRKDMLIQLAIKQRTEVGAMMAEAA